MQDKQIKNYFYSTVIGSISQSTGVWVIYLWGWLDELICVLDPAQGGVGLVCQIEQLPNPEFDLVRV
jgi:hypothetical protein